MIIIYRDGIDGLFGAVFEIYSRKLSPSAIYDNNTDVQMTLTDSVIHLNTDPEKSRRVRDGISKISPTALEHVMHAYLHNAHDRSTIIYRYLRLLFEYKRAALDMLHHPDVIALNDLYHQVKHEMHRFRGFLRFRELASGVMYAPVNPDHDILEPLFHSIKSRYGNMAFCLHDPSRSKMLAYDTKSYRVLTDVQIPEIMFSEEERTMQSVWGQYYRSVNIDERTSHRRQRQFLPMKYRRFLTELNPDFPAGKN